MRRFHGVHPFRFGLGLFALVLMPVAVSGQDDLLFYLDAGCTDSTLPGSYAQGQVAVSQRVRIQCGPGVLGGTDAVRLRTERALTSGEYWDAVIKSPDDRQPSLRGMVDLRLSMRNQLATPARFRLRLEDRQHQNTRDTILVIPASMAWTDLVIPLSTFSLTSDTAAITGVKFSHAVRTTQWGVETDGTVGAIDILVDSVRFTDGTGRGTLLIPPVVHQDRPASWPDRFLTGSYDNQTDTSSRILARSVDARYQYIMNETWGYHGHGDVGYSYSARSDSMGIGTGFVWYYLGKAGEDAVARNLMDPAFMRDFFDDYERLLDGIARSGARGMQIVLEPDMYGKLMQDGHVHLDDASTVPVDMSRANQVAGTSRAANLRGWAEHMVQRARQVVGPDIVVGHMLNHWGVNIPGQIGQGRIEAHIQGALRQGNFLRSMGDGGRGDVVYVEKSDRDAGTKGDIWFWDQENWDKYFLWTRLLSHRSGLPVVGWQVSQGHMAHPVAINRDDAVEKLLTHPQQWIDGGFIGILFGPGMEGQASWVSDGGWFLRAMDAFRADSLTLPVVTSADFGPSRIPPALKLRGDELSIGQSGTLVLYDLQGRTLMRRDVGVGEVVELPVGRGVVLWSLGSARGVLPRP